MSSTPPRLGLDEARARLKELGYLRSRVERFVFRRAFQGAAGLVLLVLLAGALALSIAETAAVASSQFRYGESPRALALLSAQLFFVALVPSAVFAAALVAAAGRSRRPGKGAAAFGLAAAGGVLLLWVFATADLGPARPTAALLWGVPVCSGAVLFSAVAGGAFLARAFARSGRLPERRRRAISLAAAAGALAIAALVFASRKEPARPAAPLPSPRKESVVVVGVDGLPVESPGRAGASAIARLLSAGAAGRWEARPGSPAEIWTDLATGVTASRHGIRALEWIRPFGLPPLQAPFGTTWYFRGAGLALKTVSRAPVSAWERRSLAFWEVAAAAGLPSLAVGWWASGPWPGATVVENREVLARAGSGAEADAVAMADFERLAPGRAVSSVYLPGPDILRDDPAGRAAAIARLRPFLESLAARARAGEIALVVVAAESHPVARSVGRMVVFDGAAAPRTIRLHPEDVAPSILARAGVPVARDLPGRPVASLFRPGSLETATVETYGDRIAPSPAPRRETDREYLEKLKSLGYLD